MNQAVGLLDLVLERAPRSRHLRMRATANSCNHEQETPPGYSLEGVRSVNLQPAIRDEVMRWLLDGNKQQLFTDCTEQFLIHPEIVNISVVSLKEDFAVPEAVAVIVNCWLNNIVGKNSQ